jgi:hypothetical protein
LCIHKKWLVSLAIVTTLSLPVAAQEASLSLRTRPSDTGIPIAESIVNSGSPDVSVQKLIINKRVDDPLCSLLAYESTPKDDPSAKPTLYFANQLTVQTLGQYNEKFEIPKGGLILKTGQSIGIILSDTNSCGEPIYVDIDTDSGTFSWNLSE